MSTTKMLKIDKKIVENGQIFEKKTINWFGLLIQSIDLLWKLCLRKAIFQWECKSLIKNTPDSLCPRSGPFTFNYSNTNSGCYW